MVPKCAVSLRALVPHKHTCEDNPHGGYWAEQSARELQRVVAVRIIAFECGEKAHVVIATSFFSGGLNC